MPPYSERLTLTTQVLFPFMATLWLCCYVQAFSSCRERGLLQLRGAGAVGREASVVAAVGSAVMAHEP